MINLREQAGRALLHRMLPDCDVVLHNYRPGVPRRLGVDCATLSAIRPDLIYAEISGFGNRGPLAGRPGGNIVAEAYGGAMVIGEKLDADGAPIRNGVTMAGLPTGIALAMGVCAALVHRHNTGEGQVVSASLLRSVLSQTGMFNMREPVSDAAVRDPMMAGVEQVRSEGGGYDEVLAARMRYHDTRGGPFHGGFRTQDGAIALGALTPANREAARGVPGMDSSPEDETGSVDLAEQRAHRGGATPRGGDPARAHERSMAGRSRDGGRPAAPVNLPQEIADDAHGSTHFVEIEHELAGLQRQARPIVELSASPTAVSGPAPLLGRHTDEVLLEHRASEAEIAALRERGGDRLTRTANNRLAKAMRGSVTGCP